MPTLESFYAETPERAELTLGFNEKNGRLLLRAVWVEQTQGGQTREHSIGLIELDAKTVTLNMGALEAGKPGTINLQTIVLDAAVPEIQLGGQNRGEGRFRLNNVGGQPAIEADASNGHLTVGTNGTDGAFEIRDRNNRAACQVSAGTGTLRLGRAGKAGVLDLVSFNRQSVIRADANTATLTTGGHTTNGRIILANASGTTCVDLDAEGSSLSVGAVNSGGDLTINARNGQPSLRLDGNNGTITAGGVGVNGDIVIKNNVDVDTIRITGSDGDIRFMNADVAEEFTVAPSATFLVEPGTVVSLDRNGQLVPCERSHDPKVMGVVAGAGGYKPALILDRVDKENRVPIAMVGKAYCKVTNDGGAITIGDLLTTSIRVGHAQKVTDMTKAIGTVIGKALGALDTPSGIIPVLVNLQ